MNDLRASLRNWWSGLSEREHRLLYILAMLLLLSALHFGVLRPILALRSSALQDIATHEALNARLRASPPQRQAQRRTGPAIAIASGAASALGLSLAASVETGTGARFTLTDAPFDLVIRWIAEVERSSTLHVRAVRLRRGADAGLVAGEVELGS